MLERGQLCASQRQICEATGMPHRQLRTFLAELESTHAVTQDVTQGRTIITICNYSQYQDEKEASDTAPTQRATQQRHSKEQGNNIPTTSDAADAPPLDPKKVAFDSGISLLVQAGKSKAAARTMIGRWVKDHDAPAVVDAIGRAVREGAADPIPFIEGCFRFSRLKAGPASGDRRETRDGRFQEFVGGEWVEVHE